MVRSVSGHVSDDEALGAARKEILRILGRVAAGWAPHEGAVVTQFVCLVEVATSRGEKALVEILGASDGYVTRWARDGMLHHALYVPPPELDAL